MPLIDRINDDLKTAMRAKDAVRLGAIRALRGEIIKADKTGSDAALTDDDVIAMAKTLIKQRQDSIAMFQKGGRDELAAKEQAELTVLQEYLPPQLTSDDIDALVKQAIASTGATSQKEMGAVMKAVKEAVAASGKDADGRIVADRVKAGLNGLGR